MIIRILTSPVINKFLEVKGKTFLIRKTFLPQINADYFCEICVLINGYLREKSNADTTKK